MIRGAAIALVVAFCVAGCSSGGRSDAIRRSGAHSGSRSEATVQTTVGPLIPTQPNPAGGPGLCSPQAVLFAAAYTGHGAEVNVLDVAGPAQVNVTIGQHSQTKSIPVGSDGAEVILPEAVTGVAHIVVVKDGESTICDAQPIG